MLALGYKNNPLQIYPAHQYSYSSSSASPTMSPRRELPNVRNTQCLQGLCCATYCQSIADEYANIYMATAVSNRHAAGVWSYTPCTSDGTSCATRAALTFGVRIDCSTKDPVTGALLNCIPSADNLRYDAFVRHQFRVQFWPSPQDQHNSSEASAIDIYQGWVPVPKKPSASVRYRPW